tara:strand:- start:30 stop:182 length:153 start_codon:yes stop_codon:yes gene_type:complete
MNKEESLRAVIDELKYENRRFEFGSALERLTRRVKELEEQLEKINKKIKN